MHLNSKLKDLHNSNAFANALVIIDCIVNWNSVNYR